MIAKHDRTLRGLLSPFSRLDRSLNPRKEISRQAFFGAFYFDCKKPYPSNNWSCFFTKEASWVAFLPVVFNGDERFGREFLYDPERLGWPEI